MKNKRKEKDIHTLDLSLRIKDINNREKKEDFFPFLCNNERIKAFKIGKERERQQQIEENEFSKERRSSIFCCMNCLKRFFFIIWIK